MVREQLAMTPAIERACAMFAHRYFAPGLETQDLLQEARIGVWKAQRNFDPSLGDWESFAKLAAERNVITAVKTWTRRKHAVLSSARCLDEPVAEGDDHTLAEILPAPTDLAAEVEQRERIRGLFGHLTDLEANVAVRRAAGYDYRLIGAELGVCEKSVDNALTRIRRKAQQALDMYDGRMAA